jgi:hypothetical protein
MREWGKNSLGAETCRGFVSPNLLLSFTTPLIARIPKLKLTIMTYNTNCSTSPHLSRIGIRLVLSQADSGDRCGLG